MKKSVYILAIILLLTSFASVAVYAASDAIVYTEVATDTVALGGKFTYSIYISGTYDGYTFQLPVTENDFTITSVNPENSAAKADKIGDKWQIAILPGLELENSPKTKVADIVVSVSASADISTGAERELKISYIGISNVAGDRATYDTSYASITILCSHSFTEKIDSQYLLSPADCTHKAVYYKSCLVCGEAGSDTFETGDELGHAWSDDYSQSAEGHYRVCTRKDCGVSEDPTECSGGTKTCTAKAICDTCKKEYGDTLPHNYEGGKWESDSVDHWKKCKDCPAEDIANKAPHTADDDKDCSTAVYCTKCNYMTVAADSHDLKILESKDSKDHILECVNEGCDHTEDRAHTFDKKVESDTYFKNNADCTTAKTYYCSCACGEKGSNTFTVGTELGHDFENGTWINTDLNDHWKKCSRCSAEDTANKVPHEYKDYSSNSDDTHSATCACGRKDTKDCSGGNADCLNKAVCDICKTAYGKINETVHASDKVYFSENDAETHKKFHECCDLLIGAEKHAFDDGEDMVCDDCEYDRTHYHGNGVLQKGSAPDCASETDGAKDYYVCSCGNKFYDDTCKEPVAKDSDLVLSWKDSHSLTNHSADPANCCKNGTIEYWDCSICMKKFSDKGVTVIDDIVELANGEHSGSAWDGKNETQHWYICTVGGTPFGHEAHKGGSANCQKGKICTECETEYTAPDEDVHIGEANDVLPNNNGTHDVKYSECGHIAQDDVTCSGGTAADCQHKAECDVCGGEHGDVGAHKWSSDYKKADADADKHYHVCTVEGCTEKDEGEAHKGGSANCQKGKICTECETEYTAPDEGVHIGEANDVLPNNNGTHDVKYSECGHIAQDDVTCSGGTATDCQHKAKCDACGGEHGDVGAHKWSSDYKKADADADKHYHVCTVEGCTEKDEGEAHKGGSADCVTPEICSECTYQYGDKKADKHASSEVYYTEVDAETHKKFHKCCDLLIDTEKHTFDDTEDMICNYCNYDRTHTHGGGVLHTGFAADCKTEKDGEKDYYICSCGNKFYDPICTEPVANDAELVIEWKHTLTYHEPDPSNCCENGTVEYWDCSVCEKKFSDEGTTAISGIVDPAKGEHSGSAVGSDGSRHWNICAVGGTPFGYEDHKGGAASCQRGKICSVCNKEYTSRDYSSHVSAWTIAVSNNNGTHNLMYACCGSLAYYSFPCTGGRATCTELAICESCNTAYGAKNANVHASGDVYYTENGSETHKKYRKCCDLLISEDAHDYANGDDMICDACGYDRTHRHGNAVLQAGSDADCKTEKNGEKSHYLCSCGKKFFDEACTEIAANDSELIIEWKHALTHHDADPANCCESGTVEYWDCSVCGKLFSDEKASSEISDTVAPATGIHTDVSSKSDGEYHWNVCAVSGAVLDKEAHSGGTATCTAKALCEVCGTEYGDTSAHKYEVMQNDAAGHWYKCADCVACGTKSEHTPNIPEATEDAAKYCTACNYIIEAQLAHTHRGGIATCTKKAVCGSCGLEYGDLASHSFTILQSDDSAHWNKCSVCAETDVRSEHSFASGNVCDVCKYEKPEETTAPVEETTAPVEETTAPVEETTAPVEETTAPVEETTAPVEETTAPVEETTVPVEETTVPVEETTVPAEETTAPGESGPTGDIAEIFIAVAILSAIAIALLATKKKKREN